MLHCTMQEGKVGWLVTRATRAAVWNPNAREELMRDPLAEPALARTRQTWSYEATAQISSCARAKFRTGAPLNSTERLLAFSRLEYSGGVQQGGTDVSGQYRAIERQRR